MAEVEIVRRHGEKRDKTTRTKQEARRRGKGGKMVEQRELGEEPQSRYNTIIHKGENNKEHLQK
jgi:hypothetical protein